MKSAKAGKTALFVASLFLLALVIALVWAIVLGEGRSRRLSLQFEVYRASAALAEAWLDDPGAKLTGGPVLGFGVYDEEGKAMVAQGSAPSAIDARRLATVDLTEGPSGSSILLMRPLPVRNLRDLLPGMRRQGMMGGGQMMGGFRDQPAPGPGAPPFDILVAGSRILWLEYAGFAQPREQLLLTAGGAVLTAVLVGIYLLILALLRGNNALREREARNRELAELGQAARTLVHEIKNPLGIISVQAATLRRREGEDSASGRAAAVIDGEVRRLARMADRLREFLKPGAGDAASGDLGAFLVAFAARHRDGGGTPLELRLPEGAEARPTAVYDPDRLSTALDNLVANAREADPEGRVEVELAGKGHSWVITVSDRGPGIPSEFRERLFEPFFTTKEKGSGIGLALARAVARGAEGDLSYAPRPGGGAVFSLSLPAAQSS